MNELVRAHLEQIYFAAIEAVHPSRVMSRHLAVHGDRLQLGEDIVPVNSFRKIYVAGAGKGAGEMAIEVERVLGDMIEDGVVAVKHFPPFTMKYIRPIVAGHPTPNENSVLAARDVLDLVTRVKRDDLLIFLLCGGASSLITDLPPYVSLKDLNHLYELLINSGAGIHEINCVRKHLSDIKGGGLARICKGTIATFIISDVPGNDLSVIGSGPTVPDPTTYTDALQVLTKYNLTTSVAPAIIEHLKNGANHYLVELVDEQGKISSRCKHYIVGDNKKAVQAAAQRATQLGYTPFVLDHQLLNDTIAEAGEFLNLIINHQPPNKRVCFIAGGETTLHVRSIGIGGRNQHFALSTLHRISEIKSRNIAILSAGTDGSDGPTPAAGAFADAQTLRIAQQLSLTLNDYLKNFDSYSFFHEANSLFITGATGTNVMDIVIAISEPAATSANDF